MILVDNNILSTFSRVGQFPLLFRLFPKDTLGISPAVYDEAMEAIRLGCSFLEVVPRMVEDGHLQIVPPTAAEVLAKQSLPRSFGVGDAESIIVCATRRDTLLTNDRRVRNYCRTQSISVFDLPELLRSLWENGVLPKKRVRRLADEMERAENMVIKNKESIFEK